MLRVASYGVHCLRPAGRAARPREHDSFFSDEAGHAGRQITRVAGAAGARCLGRVRRRRREADRAVGGGEVVDRLWQRSRQLALLPVDADYPRQRHWIAGGLDVPVRRRRQRAHRRARHHLRARPQRIARGDRRGDRPGAVGAREHDRDDQPWHELLGERRRSRPAPDLRDGQPAAAGRRADRQVGHDVRHQRCRGPACRTRRPRAGEHRQHPVEHPGRGLRESRHRRQRDRRRATCRRLATSAPTTC